MAWLRRTTVPLVTLAALTPRLAWSDPDTCAPRDDVQKRQRIGASIGYAAVDGNTDVEGDHRVALHAGSLRAAYAYRVVMGFEVGGDASFWISEYSGIAAVIPGIQVRPFLPIGSAVELGLTGRAGLLIWPQRGAGTGAWTGLGLSAGPDVRVWVTPDVALQIAGDITIASGTGPSQPELVSATAWFAAIGALAGAQYRF